MNQFYRTVEPVMKPDADKAELGAVLDLERRIAAVWHKFWLEEYARRMLFRHPDWTPRQARNPAYWKKTARDGLNQKIPTALRLSGCTAVIENPEEFGVDVAATMQSIGHEFDDPPRDWAYEVALIGYSPNGKQEKE